jgi:hypothetical protein
MKYSIFILPNLMKELWIGGVEEGTFGKIDFTGTTVIIADSKAAFY